MKRMLTSYFYPFFPVSINPSPPEQNGRNFADDILKCILITKNFVSIRVSLKFVPKSPVDYLVALVQVMAWRRSGDKPLPEPRLASSPTHICNTRDDELTGALRPFTRLVIGTKAPLRLARFSVPRNRQAVRAECHTLPCAVFCCNWRDYRQRYRARFA